MDTRLKEYLFDIGLAIPGRNEWEDWILFMLDAIEKTSIQTIQIIKGIKALMQQYKEKIRSELPKIYSQDLINNLFKLVCTAGA